MSFALRLPKNGDKRPVSYREVSSSKVELGVARAISMYGDSEKKRIIRKRTDSFSALEELVQCGICLGRLIKPKMLACQHTFCLVCLEAHILAKNVKTDTPSIDDLKKSFKQNFLTLDCVICSKEMEIENGIDGLEQLPTNLYIDSLLKVINLGPSSPTSNTPSGNVRCVKCQTICQGDHLTCGHCKLSFCVVCWSDHARELEKKLSDFRKQLAESKTRLKNKYEDLEMECMQLKDAVRVGTEEKIRKIKEMEIGIMQEVQAIFDDGTKVKKTMDAKIDSLMEEIDSTSFIDDAGKVSNYMQRHKKVSDLLTEISHFGEVNKIFDVDNYKLEEAEAPVDQFDGEHGHNMSIANALESKTNLLNYYKTKVFTSKLIWSKCPKLAGIGVAPWAPNSIYVAATDSKTVLILNRSNYKLIGRLRHPDMLCPHSLDFCSTRQETYVSDKWNHCIHVFTSDGEYSKALCSRGHGVGQVISPLGVAVTNQGDLLVCDSGNDRVLILDPDTGEHKGTIGVNGRRTEFNLPTDITTFDDKIFIADTGNHRIKIYNNQGMKLKEIGALGKEKGQFRCAEVVRVDPLGFIIVGDSGNVRLQVFDMDGQHVRSISCSNAKSDLKWISGVYVTKELDIIVTDHKNRCMQIF